ncbi:MAG: gp436 family protein [Pedobacter sp.]
MYCGINDILERIPNEILIQLTDDANLGAVDLANVNAAIDRADSEIDAWCGGRYRVPFAQALSIIAELSADMAAYHLYSRRQEIIPEARAMRYKDNVALLKEIAKGTVKLPGAAGAETTVETDGGMLTSTSPRLFGSDTLDQF